MKKTSPIDSIDSPAATYDPKDLSEADVRTLEAAGWRQLGNTLYDPQHWRPCGPDEAPDFYCYEDALVALTDEARAYVEA